jgi:hypothetical protein
MKQPSRCEEEQRRQNARKACNRARSVLTQKVNVFNSQISMYVQCSRLSIAVNCRFQVYSTKQNGRLESRPHDLA